MSRADIVESLQNMYPAKSRKAINDTVKNLLGVIADNIANGKRVEIRGFGCFSRKKRLAGIVRNPKVGVAIKTCDRFVVYFRAGNILKERVNSLIHKD